VSSTELPDYAAGMETGIAFGYGYALVAYCVGFEGAAGGTSSAPVKVLVAS
jgi:hypothetical protein